MKPTPGPWWFDGREVMTVPRGDIKICKVHPISEDDDGSANGKLLAAAPDLLKYAIKVMETLEKYGSSIVPHLMDTDDNDGQRLREVIKRAQGL